MPRSKSRRSPRANERRSSSTKDGINANSRSAGLNTTPSLELFDAIERLPSSRVIAPAFARHETFAPRFGWFRKGFLHAGDNAEAFLNDRSHLTLGVGKNMARSIRYWCLATGLLEDIPLAGQRSMGCGPSSFGRLLLGRRGWDPYLEDPGSLWMLHWNLVDTPFFATAWHFAFTVFPDVEFTVEGLAHSLASYAANEYPTARTAPSSFQKDASCIARMYGDSSSGEGISEETIQSPFVDLGLLHPVFDLDGKRSRRYRFDVGPKEGLSSEIVAAACLQFAANVAPGTQTIGMSRLIAEPGSPGMAFKLGESALVGYLEDAAALDIGVTIADAAGLVQFGFEKRPAKVATALLDHYFGVKRASVPV